MFLSFYCPQAVSLLETPSLGIDVACDQDNRPKPFLQIALEEKRYFIDDYGASGAGVLADSLLRERADPRMNDRFDSFPRCGVIEDKGAKFLAIEGAVQLQHFGAERVDDLSPGVAPGLDDFTRQFIRVDDGGSVTLENFRHRAFA